MKLTPNELTTMKSLIQKKKDHPDDPFIIESLNQYMEDIKNKYKISYTNHQFNLETGEIIESKPHKGQCCWVLDREEKIWRCALKGCKKVKESPPDE